MWGAAVKILIVDDEEPVRELISYNVSREGFSPYCAATGNEALQMAKKIQPDIIILDLMLPDMNGLDVCRSLKADAGLSSIPIIMESAKTDDSDIVAGLELGADDYITKPFSPKVLVARVRSVLRRVSMRNSSNENLDEIKTGDIRIIPKKHEVYVRDEPVELSAAEFSIMVFLAEHPGQVFSRQQIIHAVKGDGYPVTDRSVDVQILSIRRKIGDSPDKNPVNDELPLIETVRGVGYRLREDI